VDDDVQPYAVDDINHMSAILRQYATSLSLSLRKVILTPRPSCRAWRPDLGQLTAIGTTAQDSSVAEPMLTADPAATVSKLPDIPDVPAPMQQ
jgi:hypothetical protein